MRASFWNALFSFYPIAKQLKAKHLFHIQEQDSYYATSKIVYNLLGLNENKTVSQ